MSDIMEIDKMIIEIMTDKTWIRKFCDNVLFLDDKWIEKYEYIGDDNSGFDATIEEYDYFDEYGEDEIINPLFNDYSYHFVNSVIDEKIDWRERNMIFKYVLAKAKEYDMLDVVIEYFNDNEWTKLCDYYAYHRAREMLFDDDDNVIQYDFDELVNEYYAELQHKQLVLDTSMNIAISKVKRNAIFNLGLGLELSMKNCGIELKA
jgi:hypothetical protein